MLTCLYLKNVRSWNFVLSVVTVQAFLQAAAFVALSGFKVDSFRLKDRLIKTASLV